MEICIEELNHMEESYVELILDFDVFYEDLVSHKNEELAKLEVV